MKSCRGQAFLVQGIYGANVDLTLCRYNKYVGFGRQWLRPRGAGDQLVTS